jgi:precorrin-3B synthase
MTRRGWCPTLHEPMPSGDGWLARVKPFGGCLSAAQARTLAGAAAAHGNGVIELTQRGNVQVRGLTPASAKQLAEAMVAAGLASPDPAAERRRNVTVAPLADAAVVAELERRLEAASDLAALPGKFGFAVDHGSFSLDGAAANVRLRACDRHWLVWPHGSLTALSCGAEEAIEAALMFARANMSMREATGGPLTPAQPERHIGKLAHGTGIGVPFGATDAPTLEKLVDLAEQFGDGVLRITPWRAMFVRYGRVPADELLAEAMALGLIVDPADPRLSVVACPGAPACARGHARTQEDAARLARVLPGRAVHVSGCAKGCAHPSAAALTLVAAPDGYGLVRDGRAGDVPDRVGLSFDQAVAELSR